MINLDGIQIDELVQGYIFDEINDCFVCLVCGENFPKGEIFKIHEHFYEAKKTIEIHIKDQHPTRFHDFIDSDSKYLSITPTQRELIRFFHQGVSDSEIAKSLNISPSTVRHQKFMFREKSKQAKMYLAMWEMVLLNSSTKQKEDNAKVLLKEDLLPIHEGAKMVDERYVLTEEENKKILASVCISTNPLRLKIFPAKEKKKIAILNLIAAEFDKNKHYNENEVNEILKAIYDDFVTLRRYMIEYGYMKRTDDGKDYWLK